LRVLLPGWRDANALNSLCPSVALRRAARRTTTLRCSAAFSILCFVVRRVTILYVSGAFCAAARCDTSYLPLAVNAHGSLATLPEHALCLRTKKKNMHARHCVHGAHMPAAGAPRCPAPPRPVPPFWAGQHGDDPGRTRLLLIHRGTAPLPRYHHHCRCTPPPPHLPARPARCGCFAVHAHAFNDAAHALLAQDADW